MREPVRRWLEALRDPEQLADAATTDIRVHRFAPAPRGTAAETAVQVMEGRAAVATWLRLTPKSIAFDIVGEPVGDETSFVVEYAYRVDGWSNGGTWTMRLAYDRITREALIARVEHRPFALTE